MKEKKKPLPLNTVAPYPPVSSQLPTTPHNPPPVQPSQNSTLQKNQQWFKDLAQTVDPIKVVLPPVPAPPIVVVNGFPVRCTQCQGLMNMHNPNPSKANPKCGSCGGTGYVVIAKG